jgi:membrane associated rhomboid family serine protease
MLLIPYEIETLYQRHPFANWAIIGGCVLVFIGMITGGISDAVLESMVLYDWHPAGLVGHVFLHAGWVHLIGNMVFLWVFGNAVCSNTNNLIYPALFLAIGLIAGAAHLALDGEPAVGASGAVNGVIGIALAMYPLNRVHVFWAFFIRGGTFSCPVWVLALVWLLFDVWGAWRGVGGVAYWAHIGGLLGGLGVGLWALQLRWIAITEYDNRSLLEILKGEHPGG